ncbi:hypothetical protein UY3_13613 [Chelonia mydas]|uniref:Myb/SANT-like DNA-binding domain-containing protein n=1 Tax=Chelonia mydas TaxID=8469 RepID=M7B1G3_CHEMY|nr:hypothetical protein UY3_13613 [Chelonia mydas]
MRDRGYSRDATQCRVKLKELRQAYQKTKESSRHSGTEPQTCRFYAELHAIDEEEEDELGQSTQHTVLPDSQDLFITVIEILSQPNEAREGTSVQGGKKRKQFPQVFSISQSVAVSTIHNLNSVPNVSGKLYLFKDFEEQDEGTEVAAEANWKLVGRLELTLDVLMAA